MKNKWHVGTDRCSENSITVIIKGTTTQLLLIYDDSKTSCTKPKAKTANEFPVEHILCDRCGFQLLGAHVASLSARCVLSICITIRALGGEWSWAAEWKSDFASHTWRAKNEERI